MTHSRHFIALDVGEKRIGVARGDSSVKIAVPLTTIEVDGTEIEAIQRLIRIEAADKVIVGYPRNQSGDPTAQTAFVEAFIDRLAIDPSMVIYQDESLTSVLAEQQLQTSKRPYTKGDIDAKAAAIILQDYLEQNS